jgi:tripartite-type tricarboxylate transporter receptor subunit TctC
LVGLLALARTPLHVENHLSEIPQKAFADKRFRQRIYDQGSEPIGSSSDEFKIFIAAEYHRWGKLIRAVGIKAGSPSP